MTANKSIDGLSTRAAKTSKKIPKTRSVSRPISATTKKPSKKTEISQKPRLTNDELTEEFTNAPTTNIWDSIKFKDDEDTTDFAETEEITEVEEFEPSVKAKEIPKKPHQKAKKIMDIKPATEEDSTPDFLKPVTAFNFDEDEGLTESDKTVAEIRNISEETREEAEEKTHEMIDQTAKSKKHHKVKKPISKKRKIITITALVIVLLLIGGVVWAVFWGNDIIAKITGGRGNIFNLLTFTEETYDPLKTDANGRTNILAFGTGGYDMSGEEGGGVHDGAQLTDSIMLISFDQETGDVAMISLPRDLKGPATCTATGKINEVYWCNGGGGNASIAEEEKAATALMDAVGSILDVDIQYFAHLNWGSLASIVDILGGITVTLDEDIADYYYTEAVYEAGKPYNINGAEAVGLARARHGTSGGDFSRGASQQKIIIGIKDKILEKKLSLGEILGLVNTLGDNLRTNFSVSELKTIAHMPEVLDFDVMRQISLYPDYMTTGNLNGISYVLPKAGAGNYTTIKAFVAKQLSSDPREYEEPTIAIYNASDTAGLAANEKSKLETKGYTINLVDNAPAGEYPAGTTIYAINPAKAGTKHLLEEDYHVTALTKDNLPATITPNYDFIIILNEKSQN